MSHWAETLFKEQAERYAQFFEERFEAGDREAEQILELVEAEYDAAPGIVLDLACGTGRHVVGFADRGLDADGVDFSTAFVERAREHAEERGVTDRTTFRVHDVRELGDWTGSYDLVTSFWNSLGYYGRETDERILADANRLLSDDGVLAIELGNRDFYLANFAESSVDEGDEHLSVERREYDVETGRFRTRLDLFDVADGEYDHDERMEWENRMYGAPVLREMCLRAGFDEVRLFGGFEGQALDLETDTLLALAR